jgi:hypothetical protein
MTSKRVEIRPDNIPADGVVSFKNGFPILSFTLQAQDGLLDPSTIRINGNLNVYKDNLAPIPTPALAGDGLNMNNRLGIYNVIDQVTIRSSRSKMICENIRHYSKYLQTYLGVSSSLQDQMSFLSNSCLIMPDPNTFRKSVVENNASGSQLKEFSFHIPCGFIQSGNMVNLREDAFGGIQIEFHLAPDSNVLFAESGVIGTLGEAHYRLSDLTMTCEVADIPDGQITGDESQGAMEFNTITSLYTSINSTNAQIQYNLALKSVESAFMTFMPVNNINTLTADGATTTYPSNLSKSLAAIKRVQFLKGGTRFPAEFDYVNNFENAGPKPTLPDPQIIKGLIDTIIPFYHTDRTSVSPTNTARNYNLIMDRTDPESYAEIKQGGAIMGLGVRYGLSGGEDFSMEQFGVSIDSHLDTDNPIGVFIFVKAKATLLYSPNGIQLLQ